MKSGYHPGRGDEAGAEGGTGLWTEGCILAGLGVKILISGGVAELRSEKFNFDVLQKLTCSRAWLRQGCVAHRIISCNPSLHLPPYILTSHQDCTGFAFSLALLQSLCYKCFFMILDVSAKTPLLDSLFVLALPKLRLVSYRV
jgi:hypothetical protein